MITPPVSLAPAPVLAMSVLSVILGSIDNAGLGAERLFVTCQPLSIGAFSKFSFSQKLLQKRPFFSPLLKTDTMRLILLSMSRLKRLPTSTKERGHGVRRKDECAWPSFASIL